MGGKELLAPAGDLEAGYAALYYGADAVYLGLQQFSARATAANFDEPALNEFAGYAHSLGRKVFVALNTLLQECELSDLLKQLDICARCKADALIIQDLGVARVVRERYPELEMHASTQMAVHNKEGALALQKLGFKRVVLARELTLSEIKEIASVPGLDTEAFVHGALCYSYSGLCMFSSMENGRSANRGKCMYPCRSAFKGEEGEKHFFSMKDMALEEEVLKMPVTSLKIEGRKKTALYVAAVTDYYRQILDGKGCCDEKSENIKQIFSRPWCRFHVNGKDKRVIDRDFVGHRGLEIGKISRIQGRKITFVPQHGIARFDGIQIDVPGQEKPFGFSLQEIRVNGKSVFEAKAGETVEILLPPQMPHLQKGMDIYLASSSKVKGAYRYEKPKPGAYKQRYSVNVKLTVTSENVFAVSGMSRADIAGHFVAAENPDKMNDAVFKAFDKTGNTEFCLGKLEVDNPSGLFVPVSVLNELRRCLYAEIHPENAERKLPPVSSKKPQNEPLWTVKTDNPECLRDFDFSKVAEIIVEINPKTDFRALSAFPKNKLRLSLPAVCRKVSEYRLRVDELLSQGYRKWEIGNYWGLSVLPEKGIDLCYNASLYMLNSQAIEEARQTGASRVTLSWEDTFDNMRCLAEKSSLPVCLPVYEDVPLFTSAACIRSNPCKGCVRGEKWMRLSKGGDVYDVLSKDCQTMLFNDKPLCLAAEALKVGADYFRVSFMHKKYTPEDVRKIWNKVKHFQDVDGCLKGNFHRPAL